MDNHGVQTRTEAQRGQPNPGPPPPRLRRASRSPGGWNCIRWGQGKTARSGVANPGIRHGKSLQSRTVELPILNQEQHEAKCQRYGVSCHMPLHICSAVYVMEELHCRFLGSKARAAITARCTKSALKWRRGATRRSKPGKPAILLTIVPTPQTCLVTRAAGGLRRSCGRSSSS